MRLAQDRFYKTTITKIFTIFKGTNQESVTYTPYHRYTYETHNKLFDVDIRDSDGDKTYHINCGFETDKHKIHEEIEKHFGI